MRAAVLGSSPGRLQVRDVDVDAPLGHEVLVRTVACGLCHTDLHVMTGDMPVPPGSLVLGHEAAGVVEAVGAQVADIAPGDHVVACLSAFCGECAECGQGRTFLCERRRSLRRGPGERPRLSIDGSPVDAFTGIGGFAETMLLHRRAVVKVESDIPLQLAALLGCAVLTGVGSVVNGARVRPGETVAVIGIGGIGASIVQGARIAGASRIIAVDLHDTQLDLARRLGATDTVKASESDAARTVLEMTAGGVDHAFEAVGLAPTINQAVRMVRPGRDAYMVGVPPVSQPVPIPAGDMVLSGRGLRGLLMGSNHFPTDIPRMVDMYRQGRLHLDELVGRRISLDEVNDAYDDMRVGGHARPVIDFTI
jgi:S-(hydroxymethyl)glutathione dehydrogenase/alcohol dehydrogenase